MSLDKAIAHGKEHRKPYRGSKLIDHSCRNHGGCPWCEGNRKHKFRDKYLYDDKELRNMAKVNLSAPWVTFYRELDALFGEDPDITVVYDEDKGKVSLFVDNPDKADALAQLLPTERMFGNVSIQVEVVPANKMTGSKMGLFLRAFQDNPAFAYGKTITGVFSNDINYIVFKNKVVQYFNDDLGDVNGNCSTLYQEIAKDIFQDQEGVCFCTDVERPAYETVCV